MNPLLNDPFARWGLAIARRRWLVLAVWLVAIGALGGALASRAGSVLKAGGFAVHNSQSDKAAAILSGQFNASTASSVAVVFHSATVTAADPDFQSQVTAAATRLANVGGVTNIDSYFTSGNPLLLSTDRMTTIALVALAGDEGTVQSLVPKLRQQLTGVTLQHYVTGLPAVNYDTQVTSENDLHRAEAFTIPIVVLLLLLVFRTVVASAIPLLLGVGAVVLALSVIYVIGSLTPTSIFALNVTSMIGLGLGIDFSLIVVNRFREEIAAGRAPAEAVAITMASAGRSITYSGVTVIAGTLVLTLLLLDLMIVRSISLAVMIVAAAALLSGLTLLPALLAILGRRIEWLRVIPRLGTTAANEGFWYRLSHAIMRRPWLSLAASLALLIVIGLPLRDLTLIGATPGVLPRAAESVQGVAALSQGFGANQLTPIQVVIQGKQKDAVWTPGFRTGLADLAARIDADPRVALSFSLDTLPSLAVGPDGLPLGLTAEALVRAPVDVLPSAPAFVGLGRVTLPAGASLPAQSYPALQIIKPESGPLTIQVGGPATRVPKSEFKATVTSEEEPPPNGQAVQAGAPFTLAAGDQLVIPPNTPVSLRVEGAQEAKIVAVSIFVVRSGSDPQTSWTDGKPAYDMFQGYQRQVMGGSVVEQLPVRGSLIAVDRAVLQPGARIPRHVHPGPELIFIESGSFTIFGAPPDEMTITLPDGRSEEGIPGTPFTLPPGGKALVQAGRIHRAMDVGDLSGGNEPTTFVSIRVEALDEPSFVVVDPAKNVTAERLNAVPRELFTSTPAGAAATARVVNTAGANDTAIVTIFSQYSEYDARHKGLVEDLRHKILPAVPEFRGDNVYVGGDAAAFLDFRDTLYGRAPLLGGMVMLVTYVILMMFFQSVFLPLKAIVLNLLSIGATFGALVAIFQYGWGHQFLGLEPLGALSVITLPILFVILFGLSTDYEVFMLSRVKEYYHETRHNEEAVARGLQHTAGVITAAGLILIGTFGSFASANVVVVKEIGIGLAIGILLDSTIVRVVMVPATMRLAGAANWWMPAWLKRIVPELREGQAPELVPAVALSRDGRDGPEAGFVTPVSAVALSRDEPDAGFVTPPSPRALPVGQLRPTGGSVGTDLIVLPHRQPFRMGRREDNDLQLFDQRISRHHAQIDFLWGEFVLRDLGSSNGVFVNGKQIEGATALRHGDLIEIGNSHTITFSFELQQAPRSAALV